MFCLHVTLLFAFSVDYITCRSNNSTGKVAQQLLQKMGESERSQSGQRASTQITIGKAYTSGGGSADKRPSSRRQVAPSPSPRSTTPEAHKDDGNIGTYP